MLDSMDKQHLTVVVMNDQPKSPAHAIRRRQGAKIRDFRKIHNMTQQALAEKVKVTKAAVSEWERGESSPRPHIQVEIAKALQAPWTTLFGLEGEAA